MGLLRYKCSKCQSEIEVMFDNIGNSVQKSFYDQKTITKIDTDNYLWGGTYHLCPLLRCSQQQDFDNLVTRGEIIKL